jgi:DNA-binding MltR family transcriptional regulator
MKNSFQHIDLLKNEFKGASDRAIAIVAGAFLDEILTDLLRDFFVPDATSDKKIFDGTGFLSTFSSKIEMAFRLGLISNKEHKILHTIRSIRNEFAHELSELSFSTQSIRARCKNIETPIEMVAPLVIPLPQAGAPLPLPAIEKADSSDPKALFQETVTTLMHVFAARLCQANASTRSTPPEFSSAHEPAKVMLEQMKTYLDRIQELQAKYQELAKETGKAPINKEEKENNEQKIVVMIQLQEFNVRQIEAAHAARAHKI